MVVDTSVILAIVLDEAEAETFIERILKSDAAVISAGSVVELAAVSTRRFGGALDARIDVVLVDLPLSIAPITSSQAIAGREAYRRYGVGTGHPAKLNFGNCFSYALAKERGEPLLFKGDDFTHTDVARAA
jgi:ribonuclease VapC